MIKRLAKVSSSKATERRGGMPCVSDVGPAGGAMAALRLE